MIGYLGHGSGTEPGRSRRLMLAMGFVAAALTAAGLACSFGVRPTPTPGAVSSGPATAVGTAALQPTPTAIVVEGEAASAVQAATYALAVHLGREPGTLALVSIAQADFGNAALDCPRPGEEPAPVTTPGYLVVLNDGSRDYELHTSLDGLRVRCLGEDLRPDQSGATASTGIMAVVSALENREYGTLASLLPGTVNVGVFPQSPQPVAASAFIAQLRDVWLGPGNVQVDLNANVLGLMPDLQLAPAQIPVFSTGWGTTRDADGLLFFDVSGENPVLRGVWLIPAATKSAAYQPAGPEEGEEKAYSYRGTGYTLPFPEGWITFTLDSLVNLQPSGEEVAISAGPWWAGASRQEGETFRSWLEATWKETTPELESLNTVEPIWAASGQPGYLVTWNRRRADGALESSKPVALFEDNQEEYPVLAVSLLNTAYESEFRQMIAGLSIDQMVGVPADMNVYRHDGLGFRIQYPADWGLLPSPTGAGFRPPEGDVAISIGPWPVMSGPEAGQPFDQWVAAAPPRDFRGHGPVQQIQPVTAAGGETGYVATWQVTMGGGATGTSDPVAVFPFDRRQEEGVYYALALSLHVPTQTVIFERMIATLVIEALGSTAEMVLIPAGPFVRGSSDEQIDTWTRDCGGGCRANEFADEAPQRLVSLHAYLIDRAEVTTAQFKSFADAAGYRTTGERKGDAVQYTWRAFDTPERQDHPVRWMSWEDANAYCQWAGKRLPTEAEWEKAARGEDGRTWPWGNTWDETRVPHGDTVPVDGPVAAAGASPYGVLAMAGNVWEWVADWYGASYYGAAPEADPSGAPAGTDRVLRGGGFNNAAWALRAAHRHSGGEQGYATDHGFRCAADR